MSPASSPASHVSAPLTLEAIVAKDERDRVALVQHEVLAALGRTPLELDGDVEVLALALRYLAHAHGIDVESLALRAVASTTRCGTMQ